MHLHLLVTAYTAGFLLYLTGVTSTPSDEIFEIFTDLITNEFCKSTGSFGVGLYGRDSGSPLCSCSPTNDPIVLCPSGECARVENFSATGYAYTDSCTTCDDPVLCGRGVQVVTSTVLFQNFCSDSQILYSSPPSDAGSYYGCDTLEDLSNYGPSSYIVCSTPDNSYTSCTTLTYVPTLSIVHLQTVLNVRLTFQIRLRFRCPQWSDSSILLFQLHIRIPDYHRRYRMRVESYRSPFKEKAGVGKGK